LETDAMTKSSLTFSSETPAGGDGGLVVFALAGPLNGLEAAYEFQDAVRRTIAGGCRKIVLDLAEVGRVDSCGIGILASLMWSASQAGAGMVLATIPPQVEKLLQIVTLLDHVDHAPSREAAIALLRRR
jgi:anti-sigma B factor antagonist